MKSLPASARRRPEELSAAARWVPSGAERTPSLSEWTRALPHLVAPAKAASPLGKLSTQQEQLAESTAQRALWHFFGGNQGPRDFVFRAA